MERIKSRRRRRIKSRRESVTEEEQPVPPKEVSDDSYVDDTELPAAAGSLSRAHSSDFTYMEDSSEGISSICGCKASDLHKVIGWEFAIPNDTRNCVVHVFVSRDVHDDYVYMTVVTANPPYKKLSEKRVTIDELFDVVETVRNIDQMAEEDASSLRILLRNIFVEADEDHSGHLSFSELQVLLDKINLGLSSADLRSIVAEADVDESGFVDYEEFVPIAIDMVLGYRARARANVHHIDAAVADLIHQSISVEEVERIDAYCMTQFKLSDPLNNGVISFNLFKSRLNRAVGIGLSPNDVRLLCQNIPRDYRGRCLYLSFKEVLYDVRFMSANNAIIEDQGSDLQRHIIDLCLQEERRLADQVCSDPDDFSDTVLKGQIPLRSMVDILLTSPLLSLNRLQVMLLTSEANVVKGKVSIYQFVPACVKTIEMMFDPQALRVRAELLAGEDLSVESLLDGEKQEDFDRRLALLFKSNDLDGSGGLDAHEFSSCMASLNLGITDNEIESLYSLATSTATVASQLNYDEFAAFVSRNLLDLVREKRIRAIEISKKERTSRASVVRRVGEKLDVLLAVYMEASTGGYVAFDSVAEALQQSGRPCWR
jgi:Ca2+-binding EF-hand superfamily protein